MERFAERLRELRKEKGLNQEDLGKLIGVEKLTISGYESGFKEIAIIKRLMMLADIFDCSIDYLLGLTDVREKYPPAAEMEPIDLTKAIEELPPIERRKMEKYVLAALKKKKEEGE